MIVTALVMLLAATPAAAQVDLGTGFGPEAFLHGERGPREQMPILPLALATSLAFDATTWATVGLSTVPARDISSMIKRGYYKLEVIQAVLLASKAQVPLKDITAAHDKGRTLRELALERKVDFDPIYEEALRLDRLVVERWLPSIMRVSVDVAYEAPAAPKAAPRRKEKKP